MYCKLEYYGPTHSYKDRIASLVIEEAISQGFSKVALVSSGNNGLAMAYAANAKELGCTVLCASSILPKYKEVITSLGAQLVRFESTEAAYKDLGAYKAQGYFVITVPFEERDKRDAPCIKGYGSISEEIVNELGKAPDFIVTPTCYADGSKGMLLRFLGLKEQNIIDRVPQFLLARTKETERDLAYSISTDRTSPQVEYVLEKSSGQSLYVTEEECVEGQKTLADECGFLTEVSSGAVVSALKEATREGLLHDDSTLVIVLTAGIPN